MLLIAIAVWVIQIVSFWKVFVKAGQPGWAAIIPFYNAYVSTKIAKCDGIYTLLLFIPLVNIDIAKAFGKSTGFGVLMTLIPIVSYPMIGFSDAVYDPTPKQA
jgi:hypothetical protein